MGFSNLAWLCVGYPFEVGFKGNQKETTHVGGPNPGERIPVQFWVWDVKTRPDSEDGNIASPGDVKRGSEANRLRHSPDSGFIRRQ